MKIEVAALYLSSFILFFSCTTNSYAKIDGAVGSGDYKNGTVLLESNKNLLYKQRDNVLYYLDKGMIAHYAEDYEDSMAALQKGERAIEAAFTKSIMMEIGTYILNDTVQEYQGEDYEDIYINAFNALNYYHKNNIEDAMVEIRRMNNKLLALSTKYGILLDNIQKKALEDGTPVPANPKASTKFSNSALARYLGMLFYRSIGNNDDARIDGDQLQAAFANAPSVYNHKIPSSIKEELVIPKGKVRLNVIAFAGLSPIKESSIIRIPLSNDSYIKIALPVMINRSSIINRIEVIFDNGGIFNLELLENIEAIVKETFKAKEAVIYTKSIIRGSAKGAMSASLNKASEENKDSTKSLLLSIFSLGAQLFTETTEKADLRVSRYFPAKAYIGGITLDPGIYSFRINYYDMHNKLIETFYQKNVQIVGSGLNLIETACLK